MLDASALEFHHLFFRSFVVPLKSIAVVPSMLSQAMRKAYKKVDGRIYVSWWESGQIENKQATHMWVAFVVFIHVTPCVCSSNSYVRIFQK